MMFLGCCSLAFSQAPRTAVPEQFRPLYESLDEALRETRRLYPLNKADMRPDVAPNLLQASTMYAPAAPDSPRWKDLMATLDAFQAMGTDAVLAQILAPDLALGDTSVCIEFYRRLANEIHARKMKFYVEHFFNMPFVANQPKDRHAPPATADFLKIMQQEALLIYRELKPDYLTLINEPEMAIRGALHLSLSADELAQWVGGLADQLKSTGESPNTLLGAGAALSEPEDYVGKFARQAKLDYVDIHLYTWKVKSEGDFAKLAALIHKVREARPGIKVTIGESWLLKHGAGAPKVTGYEDIFARNDFSFWSPLDAQFLSALIGFGQKENISAVAPFFSQYFFSYYTFGDAESKGLPPWPRSISASWSKALEAVRAHRLSATGEALRAMLGGTGK
jgi:hypothetical protein